MKPYVSQILEHNGKTHRLPIPSKYRELLDCVRTLGIKTVEDEDDMRIVGYETLMNLPVPNVKTDAAYKVESIAKAISSLAPGQVAILSEICDKFNIDYMCMGGLIDCIKEKIGGKSE